MDFELTPEQAAIRAVAREFAEAELGDKIAPYDERHEFAADIVAKLGPLGLHGRAGARGVRRQPRSTTCPTR